MVNSCAYGKVNRNMIENIEKREDDFETYIKEEFKDFKELNINLYNHLSTRLPIWATILFTILGSMVTGFVVYGRVN